MADIGSGGLSVLCLQHIERLGGTISPDAEDGGARKARNRKRRASIGSEGRKRARTDEDGEFAVKEESSVKLPRLSGTIETFVWDVEWPIMARYKSVQFKHCHSVRFTPVQSMLDPSLPWAYMSTESQSVDVTGGVEKEGAATNTNTATEPAKNADADGSSMPSLPASSDKMAVDQKPEDSVTRTTTAEEQTSVDIVSTSADDLDHANLSSEQLAALQKKHVGDFATTYVVIAKAHQAHLIMSLIKSDNPVVALVSAPSNSSTSYSIHDCVITYFLLDSFLSQLVPERDDVCECLDDLFLEYKQQREQQQKQQQSHDDNDAKMDVVEECCLSKSTMIHIIEGRIPLLPPLISRCVALTSLTLREVALCQLPEEVSNYPSVFGLFTKQFAGLSLLQFLDLSYNWLTSFADYSFPFLKLLDLKHNRLAEVPPLQEMVELRYLSVAFNCLEAIPDNFVSNCVVIQHLDLNHNSIAQLPPSIFRCSSLKTLDVGFNRISLIPSSISQLTSIRYLYLHNNEIESLPPQIGQLLELRVLNVSTNPISAVPEELALLRKLHYLNISNSSVRDLPSQLASLSKMEMLLMRRCALKCIPSAVFQMKQLASLDVSHNKLHTVPRELSHLRALQRLFLKDTMIRTLPSLSKLRSLVELDVSMNNCPDLVDSISPLVSLKELQLSYNQIASIAGLASLTRLCYLDLGHNKLTAIDELESFSNLAFLDVRCNKLPKITPVVKKLPKLKTAFFGYNKFSANEKKELKKYFRTDQ